MRYSSGRGEGLGVVIEVMLGDSVLWTTVDAILSKEREEERGAHQLQK